MTNLFVTPQQTQIMVGDMPRPEVSGLKLETRLLPDTVLGNLGIRPDTFEPSPRAAVGSIINTNQGDRLTLTAEVATIDGAVQAQQDVVDNGSQLLPVSGVEPVNNDPNASFTQGLIDQINAGSLVAITDADGRIVLVAPDQAVAAPPPPGADQAGANLTGIDSSQPGALDPTALPAEGCETNTEINFDQNGDVQDIIVTHFDGIQFERA